MASAPSARSPAPSASISSTWRQAMQRSSESIGSLAAALAKAQGELTNPEKSLVGDHPVRRSGRSRTDVSLCPAVERARHRAQDLGPA